MPTVPAPGTAKTMLPKTIDMTPLKASTHSPWISLRSRIAATSSRAPVTIAQAAINMTSARTVALGQRCLDRVGPRALVPARPADTEQQVGDAVEECVQPEDAGKGEQRDGRARPWLSRRSQGRPRP